MNYQKEIVKQWVEEIYNISKKSTTLSYIIPYTQIDSFDPSDRDAQRDVYDYLFWDDVISEEIQSVDFDDNNQRVVVMWYMPPNKEEDENKEMNYQEIIKNAVQKLYKITEECATSRHYTFGYGWVNTVLGINLSNKNVRDDVWEMSYSNEFCDLIQTVDFDDDCKEVTVMLWKSNNKKKYTIEQYEEFCKNALIAPPIEEFEDGTIDEDKWYKEHNIHIVTGDHDIELEYHADNVNEIEFALREMYEVENDIIGATTGNTVGSEYRPAELKDIIQFAIQDEFNHFGYKMNNFAEFIQYFIKKEWDLEKVMWHYTVIFKDIKYYNDCYKCNFGKLDMDTMNGICSSKIQDIVDGLICKDRELLYGVTEDDKSSDIVFVMDNTLRPGGDLVGWFYGEPSEEYIDELISDYKNKLFGEEN